MRLFYHITKKYTGKIYSSEEIINMFGPPEEVTIERLVGKERYVEAMDEFYNFYETHHFKMANAYRGI